MNDRSFAREKTKRSLLDIVEKIEAAEAAELAGDFEQMEKEDQMAGMLLLVQSITINGELKEGTEKGLVAETMGKMKKDQENADQ